MKVLILGADGFVGRNVLNEVKSDAALEVVSAGRGDSADYSVDLLKSETIVNALAKFQPDVIINCAGIVANTEDAYKNGEFCRNMFEAVLVESKPYPKVIVTGSAAEYGVIENGDVLVNEKTPLLATSDYGKSKIQEEEIALEYANTYSIDTVVARVFNPIGPGMGEKFLLTSLLKQITEIRSGTKRDITVSRRDSLRDYVDVRDVAKAIHLIATSKTGFDIYNIGSGTATSNGELIDVLLKYVELGFKPTIIESRSESEPTYAARADIDRMKSDLGWQPTYNLDRTVEDIIHAESNK